MAVIVSINSSEKKGTVKLPQRDALFLVGGGAIYYKTVIQKKDKIV